MSAESYTPTEAEVREAVAEWMWTRSMWREETSHADGAELDRFLDALSSPPADDVREAMMNALACHRRKVTVPAFNRPVCSCGWASTTVDYGAYAFDGHIADAVAAEVRPYGTVTDAAHDRDGALICRKCGQGLTALDLINGERPCLGPHGTVSDTHVEWEYRGVVCEPDTGDVYDSTRPFDTEAKARQAALDWVLLESSADLPQLILRAERRRKAGSWGPVEAAGEARS